MKRVIVGLMMACALSANAELLFGIGPLETLGDIRKRFPNATFKQVKAAWVKEDQGLYSMEGPGHPGKLVLAFSDGRPLWRELAASARSAVQAASEPTQGDLDWASRSSELAHESDDVSLTISWVRWIPPAPIPLTRYKAKYGQPDKCGFSDADMSPYCEWTSRALLVELSDDQRNVIQAETAFTRAEMRAAHLRKYQRVPDYLKDEPASKDEQPKAKPVAPSRVKPTT